MIAENRLRPGQVRDAVVAALRAHPLGATVSEILGEVRRRIGGRVPESSIRSCLRLNSPSLFVRLNRGCYQLAAFAQGPTPARGKTSYREVTHGTATVVHADCLDWLVHQPNASISAVVTDPPYGLVEYSPKDQLKLRRGKGGIWRLPPSFDGVKRSPLPRFTTLSTKEREDLANFFAIWGSVLAPALVPGANVVVATNSLLSYIVAGALVQAGLERRGEIVRLVTTMRGGDRPKGAHHEFSDVSVMPRSMWEPWLVFRKPLEGRVQDNLRIWGTGGFRRPCDERPFGDVIHSAPTRKEERALAPHPSLKPQDFLRTLVRGVLPLGEGVVVDPFCGSGSTLAAAVAVGYKSIGVEKDNRYFEVAAESIPKLAAYCPLIRVNDVGPQKKRFINGVGQARGNSNPKLSEH